ncbi:molybdopterin-guanine dinucleotide biosynthesis protein B [Paenibacillus lemnae]|uniref:Molybdopterin-guanine dinucleotide biosynthesis protein B n=1 Tax=Paenibacillus lemnae TaxID=1330551 RepID=A0A848M575_PAELE|nr:molybdopterin-guanine dinucleotide biosynthesis protein B [Paenibacillus lemnae]NMO95905.1 molybdopterin-guanine dinucleotide biosynthesis protein B [Paenibacillus lemnae]
MNAKQIWQITGYKNSGKTTLITALLPMFKGEGKLVGVIKHDAHDFVMDHPGSDTFRFTESGADLTIITSAHRTAVLKPKPMSLDDILAETGPLDWTLVEGFKQEKYPKLLMLRDFDDTVLYDELITIRAVILHPDMLKKPERLHAWKVEVGITVPVFSRDETSEIFHYMVDNA